MALNRRLDKTRPTTLLLTVLLGAGCPNPPQATTPAERPASTPTRSPIADDKKLESATTSTVASETKTSSLAGICRDGFDEALQVIERQAFELRIGSSLIAIATACPALSDAIVRSARKAAAQGRVKRAKTLYEAIKNRLPESCRSQKPEASAKNLGQACFGDRPDLSRRLIADMDLGTFSFFLIVEEELKAKSLHDANAKRLLVNLLLATAMEGEKRKKDR